MLPSCRSLASLQLEGGSRKYDVLSPNMSKRSMNRLARSQNLRTALLANSGGFWKRPKSS
jgi:hypothetical protein